MEHITINLAAYRKLAQDEAFVRVNKGKFALFHKGKFVVALNGLEDAYEVGMHFYPNNDFFIHEVDPKPKSMGSMGPFVIPVA